jgi:hypothetical protein
MKNPDVMAKSLHRIRQSESFPEEGNKYPSVTYEAKDG